MTDPRVLLEPIRAMHAAIRDQVVESCERTPITQLSDIVRDDDGDTIYEVDRISEDVLLRHARSLAEVASIVLIAEGLTEGPLVLPEGTSEAAAEFRVLMDPVDGTRGLMYQKRSAWILTAVAPNHGPTTRLSDVTLAVQTEIPVVKQHLCDELSAIRGEGATAARCNRLTGERRPLQLAPSSAKTIAHGFAQIARFFPGVRDELAAIDEEIARGAVGPIQRGKAAYYEDQYVSTGGQLYELMAGHDRFCADLRPLMEPILQRRGEALGICAHPYDLCTELIARELGVLVVGIDGAPLDCPLDLDTEVTWVGFANERIYRQVMPLLQDSLRRRRLIDGTVEERS